MSSSQMERYIWSSILYYIVSGFGFTILFISIGMLGGLWDFVALLAYLILLIFLNAWRRRSHPGSVYQVKLAQRQLDD
ncbi:MAG: hypothetical protein E5X48_24490 [Mesorhizobium sp.]|nr:MAG: hypothetical protein E5X48_24490 [Mesorhizobium sp.]